MGAPIVVPFDNNPIESRLMTTSYTIPAGRFAKFKAIGVYLSESLGTNPAAQSRTSPTIQIGGQIIPCPTAFSVSFVGNNVDTARNITYSSYNQYVKNYRMYTVASGGIGVNIVTQNANAGYTSEGNAAATGTASETIIDTNIRFITSLVFNYQNTSTVSSTQSAQISFEPVEPCDWIWLKAGSVINIPVGVGRYLLTEYNAIS